MVRATFAGFSTALSALQANQKRLDITGQNLSNMNTVGYTRQQLNTSSLNYTGGVCHTMNGSENVVGFGVSMDGVSQVRDPYLDTQYRLQMTKADYNNSMQTALDSLANILDETNISGLNAAFKDIQSVLTNINDPSKVVDPVYESELRSKMENLAALFNKSASQITEAEKSEFDRVTGAGTSEQGAVDKINDILRQIGELNVQIKQNQVAGQPSLEMMDERNVLLDTLSSYIPIEVSYYKDSSHSGTYTAADGSIRDRAYDYDASGKIIGKREWPDDLKVELVYTDAQGKTQRMTLVNGSEQGADGKQKNYGQLEAVKADNNNAAADRNDPTNVAVKFTAAQSSAAAGTNPATTTAGAASSQFSGGSLQASLDMLGKKGTGGTDDVRGYQYYMSKLDTLAKNFTDTMNDLNKKGGGGELFMNSATGNSTGINASNISISTGWTNGKTHIATGGDSPTDTVRAMLKAMSEASVEGKTYANYMNHVSTQLATDSSSNTTALKTNVTVLNSIQSSKDSISGVSMDEEATNMMTYVSAYNAASRLMTALDEVLNTLISNTGMVGR